MEYDISALKTNLQKPGKNSESYPKRLHNINWIKELDRTGLSYGDKEKQLIIVTPEPNTEILIQYPGKESVLNPEEPDDCRPWDFRPKVFYRDKNSYCADLAFVTLWENFEQQFSIIKERDALRILSILLYRMAFMIDHRKTVENKLTVRYFDREHLLKETTEDFNPWLMYSPPKETVQYLNQHMPKICGMSCEAFLYYIELLTWNEDCKYYYRKIVETAAKAPRGDGQERAIAWINGTGRVNTLLTIINFIGVLLGEVKMSGLFAKFAFYGVAGVTDDDISRICKGGIS